MAILSLDDFAAGLPPAGALAGLDVGTKTIGVAVSDATRFIATPLETIARTKFSRDIQKLAVIIAERRIIGLVIGLPLNMDGSEGPRCQSIRQFAENCLPHLALSHLTIPMTFWDERLSTAAVTRTLIEQDASRRKRAAVVDRMAAAYILQGVLDYLRHRGG